MDLNMNQIEIETPLSLIDNDPPANADDATETIDGAGGLVQRALRGAELAATGVALVAFSPVILSMHASQILHKRFFDNGDTAA
jgi:hypothetical protein